MSTYFLSEWIEPTPFQRFKNNVVSNIISLRHNYYKYKLYYKLKLTGDTATVYSYNNNKVLSITAQQLKSGHLYWTFGTRISVPGYPTTDHAFVLGENFWISINGYLNYVELF